MKTLVAIITVLFGGSLICLCYFLLGGFEVPWFNLTLPTTTAEFGDSIGILNGLFSSIAVLLALVAVLLQSKELKAATDAQNDQAKALQAQVESQKDLHLQQIKRSEAMLLQIEQQQLANKVIVLQAQNTYHASELARMDKILDKIKGKHDQSNLWESCLLKKKAHLAEIKVIHEKITELSNSSNSDSLATYQFGRQLFSD